MNPYAQRHGKGHAAQPRRGGCYVNGAHGGPNRETGTGRRLFEGKPVLLRKEPAVDEFVPGDVSVGARRAPRSVWLGQ